MADALPLVSVVIPHWNGIEYLPVCLDSLRRQTYPQVEIIVVDNASTDGSQAFVSENYPEVHLIALPENRGFTGGCNAGMKAAQGDVIILLNNDTEVEPNWIEEVVAAFDRHPEAGMVASRMLLFDRRDTLHTAGDTYSVDGQAGNRGVWQLDGPRYNREEPVFSACGGSAAYRRSMLDETGFLDDDFFFSMEDIDLAWRAQLAGWRCIYAPGAVVYHHLKATGGGATASYYDGRNMLWVIAKNYPGPLLRRYWRQVFRAQAGLAWEALRAWRGEAARARLRGMLAGLWRMPAMLHKRKRIQAGRKESLAVIESLLAPPADAREGVVVLLEDATGRIALQLRDGGSFANHWGLFGGWMRQDELPEDAALREIREELSSALDPDRLVYLRSYPDHARSTLAYVFHYPVRDELEQAVLREGQAYRFFSRKGLVSEPVMPFHRAILDWYFSSREISPS
jgi:GT2 family glycosyltransferase/ADP-ribose pyrophosphatase YjhB (NUDIX family)